jgi:hypothetical protein
MIALNEQSGFGAPDFVESQRKKINRAFAKPEKWQFSVSANKKTNKAAQFFF